MRISDWSSDVCSSDLKKLSKTVQSLQDAYEHTKASLRAKVEHPFRVIKRQFGYTKVRYRGLAKNTAQLLTLRSEEHTSELQSLMRISYAVFCLKKKKENRHRLTQEMITEPTIKNTVTEYA